MHRRTITKLVVSKGRLSAVRRASDLFLDNGLENWKQSISDDVNIIPQEPRLTACVTYGFPNMSKYREHMGRSLGLEIC